MKAPKMLYFNERCSAYIVSDDFIEEEHCIEHIERHPVKVWRDYEINKRTFEHCKLCENVSEVKFAYYFSRKANVDFYNMLLENHANNCRMRDTSKIILNKESIRQY